MFNNDFYPTPTQVVDIMLAGVDLEGKIVLEPSAGKGDIIDELLTRGATVVCCELNEDLAVIAGTKARLIAHDFLTVESQQISHVDYIIMNPPFSADETHINHAWKMAPAGCEIISICNWQTIENDYSRSRRILKSTIESYGTASNIGDVFNTAERKTGVEIGLIHLIKPGTSNDYAEYFTDEDDEPEKQENGLMSYNAIREVVQRYVHAVQEYDKVLESAVRMNDLTKGMHVNDIVFTCTRDKAPVSRDEFAKELQKKSWGWIISKMNLEKYNTKGLMEDINKFVEQQKQQKFTMKNVYLMLDAIIQTTGQRMDRALVEVFDNLTSHYHENRYNVEGWKTNSHYLVNQKFIMPYIAPESKWFGMEVNDCQAQIVDDFCKALCYITGGNWSNTDRFSYQVRGLNPEFGQWFEWGFFEVKLFKKGTGHFKFKDLDVWARFNQEIARIKGFPLPENIRRKAA